MNISPLGYIRVPMSTETIMRLKPKIQHVKEHGFTPFTPECIDKPLTKEQFMVAYIIDTWSLESFIITSPVIREWTLVTTPAPTPIMTPEDRAINERNLQGAHIEKKRFLSIIWDEIIATLNGEWSSIHPPQARSSNEVRSPQPQVSEEDSTDSDSPLKDSMLTHRYNHIIQRIENENYDTIINLGKRNKSITQAYEENSLVIESERHKLNFNVEA